jgi:hypothetical protein
LLFFCDMKRSTKGTRRAADAIPPAQLVSAGRAADVVSVPRRCCLAIDGAGSPQAAVFQQAVAALFGVAYALKFARKKEGQPDFKVGPLEGHWSADVDGAPNGRPPPDRWRWRLRIGVPAEVTKAQVEDLKRDVTDKLRRKGEPSVAVAGVFLETVPAQRLGRILHVGPYATEPESLASIDHALEREGLVAAPTHIEVYRKDPRRVRPAALETVLLRELAGSAVRT